MSTVVGRFLSALQRGDVATAEASIATTELESARCELIKYAKEFHGYGEHAFIEGDAVLIVTVNKSQAVHEIAGSVMAYPIVAGQRSEKAVKENNDRLQAAYKAVFDTLEAAKRLQNLHMARKAIYEASGIAMTLPDGGLRNEFVDINKQACELERRIMGGNV